MYEWQYQGKPVTEMPEGVIGFIYIITLPDGRKYLGRKKSMNKKTNIRTVTLKNGTKKKKKIRSLVDSDWREYWSSSELVKALVEELGPDDFTREIIRFCKTESEMTYIESKEIFVRECLETEDWVNAWVSCRVRKSNIMGKI